MIRKKFNDVERSSEIDCQDGQLFLDSCSIIEQAQSTAYHSVNEILVKRNWLLGMRIQHEVLKEQRAEYGEQIINKLSAELTAKYGRGFKKSNLYLFVTFYNNHPDFFQSPIGKLLDDCHADIFQSLTGKSPINLSWTHYSIILQEKLLKVVLGTKQRLLGKCGVHVLCSVMCHRNITIAC